VLWAFGMSLLIYAGSMQYVAIDLMTGGVSLLTTALTTLAVNARHLFYGISMVDKYKVQKKKYFLFWTLTDETYSLVCSDEPEKSGNASAYYTYVSLFDYSYWVLGSVLGSLLGGVIPFSMEGIDFSLTALFLTVFVEQWLSTKNHLAALVGVGASVLCLLLFGSDKFLIPAMILIAVLLIMLRKKEGITND
jgi:4-azaleucine resistance transporter AzlC